MDFLIASFTLTFRSTFKSILGVLSGALGLQIDPFLVNFGSLGASLGALGDQLGLQTAGVN